MKKNWQSHTQCFARNVVPFYHPIKIVTSQYRCCKRASKCCSSWKMRQMSPLCKMADNGPFTVDQKVKVVLLYAETKSVIATQRRFRAHFGTRWAPCKQTIYRLSLGTIFQPMRINSVPDLNCFCNNKNVLCVQSIVWHFVRHLVFRTEMVLRADLSDRTCRFRTHVPDPGLLRNKNKCIYRKR